VKGLLKVLVPILEKEALSRNFIGDIRQGTNRKTDKKDRLLSSYADREDYGPNTRGVRVETQHGS